MAASENISVDVLAILVQVTGKRWLSMQSIMLKNPFLEYHDAKRSFSMKLILITNKPIITSVIGYLFVHQPRKHLPVQTEK